MRCRSSSGLTTPSYVRAARKNHTTYTRAHSPRRRHRSVGYAADTAGQSLASPQHRAHLSHSVCAPVCGWGCIGMSTRPGYVSLILCVVGVYIGDPGIAQDRR
jgi:hypothetical protein